jgi:hypothetical protein
MSKISPLQLDDTLYVIQLARETALAAGKQKQAERLTPVIDNLRDLVATSKAPKPALESPKSPEDFRRVLEATQAISTYGSTTSVVTNMERNKIIIAMSSADVPDADIARQLGITREEVRLVLSVQQSNRKTIGG